RNIFARAKRPAVVFLQFENLLYSNFFFTPTPQAESTHCDSRPSPEPRETSCTIVHPILWFVHQSFYTNIYKWQHQLMPMLQTLLVTTSWSNLLLSCDTVHQERIIKRG